MLRDKSLIHKRGRCRKFGNHSLSGHCLIPQHATCEPGLGLFFSRFCKHSQRKWFHYDLLNLIFLWWLFVSSHGVDKWNTQGWEADRKKTNVFFSFTLHALAIIILLYAKEASYVEPHCCGEKERKETGIMCWAQWSISVLCLLLPIPPSVDDRCSVMRLKHPRPAPSSCHQPN